MPITIFAPNGEATEYRTVSERLPEFKDMFPAKDGFRVIRSHKSAMEFGSDVHRLWEQALASGFNPNDLGLPRITGMAVIFTASLYKGDDLIQNASAFKRVAAPKDWEAGETASFQRLMAACGLGGTDMDMDDQYDRLSSGLEMPKAPESESDPETEQPQTEQPQAEPEQAQVQDSEVSEPTGKDAPAEPAQAEEKANESNEDSQPNIRPQLLNQLKHVANLAGEPVPEVASEKEAKAEIKRLNAASRAS